MKYALLLLLLPSIYADISYSSKKLLLKLDLSEDRKLEKSKVYFPANGTHWFIKNGVLIGQGSTPDELAEAKKAGKKYAANNVPRLKFFRKTGTPKNIMIECSFMIKGGKTTNLVPMIESGHHRRRIYFSEKGIELIGYGKDGKNTLDKSTEKIERNKWYDIKMVIKADQFDFYLNGKKHLSAKHQDIIIKDDDTQIAIAGPSKGEFQIKKLVIYEIK